MDNSITDFTLTLSPRVIFALMFVPLFLIGFPIYLTISSKLQTKREYIDKKRKIELRIEKRMNMLTYSENVSVIPTSIRIILDSYKDLESLERRHKKEPFDFEAKKLSFFESVNEILHSRIENLSVSYENGSIRKKTYQSKLGEIEKYLQPSALNYDGIKSLLDINKNILATKKIEE